MKTAIRLVLILTVFGGAGFLTGCSEVRGSVTDAETGAPIEGAEVGLIIRRPFRLFPDFRPEALTNGAGVYHFTHTEPEPRIYVRAPGYLTRTRAIPRNPEVNLNFEMQSIEDLIGEWDVTLNIAGLVLGRSQFVFGEDGLQWFSRLGFLGNVDFSFDGANVFIDNALTIGGDGIAGELTANLTLNSAGNQLFGEIDFNHLFFLGNACGSGCGGTLTATRTK